MSTYYLDRIFKVHVIKFASRFANTAADRKPVQMRTPNKTSLIISFSNICIELKATFFKVSEEIDSSFTVICRQKGRSINTTSHWKKFLYSPLQSPEPVLILSLLHSMNEEDNIVKKKKKTKTPLLECFPGCSLY